MRLRGQKQVVLTEVWLMLEEAKLLTTFKPEWSYSEETLRINGKFDHGDATSLPAGMCRQPQLADSVCAEDWST